MTKEHEGHRERLKNRFLTEGLEHFEPHNILELLLFYSIPRKDTNLLAHALLDHFGSFVAVMNASPEELAQVPGITMNSAVHLHLISEVARRYYSEVISAPPAEAGKEDKLRYLGEKLVARSAGLMEENLFVICLDNSLRELSFDRIASGTPDELQIRTRQIAELAFKHHAPAVIIAHNHPGGIAIPSRADIISTLALKKALDAIYIRLLDHFVVAGDDYVSMQQSGYFSKDFMFSNHDGLRSEADYGEALTDEEIKGNLREIEEQNEV